MTLETDLLLDRRRLKRRLVFWRVLSVLIVVAAVLAGLRSAGLEPGEAHIARVSVTGLITEDRKLTEAINDLATDTSVRAVIVSIDSPGGSVAGGESLHDAIARVAKAKPLVAVMRGTAASAGYMVAVPADRIFAREATLTGSIGVLLETPEFSGLLDKLGIGTERVRSGPLKDEPSLIRPLSPEGKQVLQGLVNDMYDQFVGMVAAGRHMDADKVRSLADGRPYTGRQALSLGLVDAIGGEREARAWLASAKGISTDLPVEDVSTEGFARSALSGALAPMFQEIWKTLVSQSVSLDGAWAVWQRSGH
ncbi:signal peptide peptidase SppA [Rhodopila globiformis]|uniref:Signal peptide peptidase SppA n=1 Tax=Rhodopila globiformis TaxID=1071 RepID=A0A2S6NIH1_RHOGL|nr:signal peptide peptidase SppA [Rhodopila globiformis]PPQ34450.1 signal peptide peptidase SppA [Rhodopila globiformis]